MKQRLFRMRRWGVAALAGVTVLGAASVVGEGVASATVPTVTATASTTVPTFLGTSAVVTNPLTVSTTGVLAIGDVITLTVGCPASGSLVLATPAVTTLTGTNSASWTASLSSNNACGAGVKNQLLLTLGTPPTANLATSVNSVVVGTASATTGIAVTATNVPSGNIVVTGTYANATGSTTFSVPTLASISNVTVQPASPLSVVPTGSGDAAIGNLTVTAPSISTIPAGDAVCLTLVPPTGSTGTFGFDTINGLPTVTQSNGASNATLAAGPPAGTPATQTGAVQDATIGFVTLAQSTTNAPSYTVGNLHVEVPTTAVNGSATVNVGYAATVAACSTPTSLVTGLTAFIVGSAPSTAIYGATADATTAAEFDAQFVSTSNATASCTDNGNAVIATNADPYDALSASYLEGLLHTGVLITSPTSPSASMLAALKYAGVQRVYVVGGLLAVSQADITALEATPAYNCGGLTTTGSNIVVYSGISGQTADQTAVAIDNYVTTSLSGNLPTVTAAYGSEATYNQTTGNETTVAPVGSQTTALVVSDTDYQDAATAAGLAWKYHLPVILTTPLSLSSTASGELTKLGITQVIALGGQLALTPSVITSIQAITVNSTPISVLRIAGQDGTQTAADIAMFEGAQLSWPASTVLVAQGAGWSDALGAAAISGSNSEPLLLTEGPVAGVGNYTAAVLKTAGTLPSGLGSGVTAGIQVLGGPLAVPQTQITQLQQDLAAG